MAILTRPSKYMTPDEAAELLRCDRRRVYELRSSGCLRRCKVNPCPEVRIPGAERRKRPKALSAAPLSPIARRAFCVHERRTAPAFHLGRVVAPYVMGR